MEDVDFSRSSLYGTLAERYQCYVMSADEVFEPVLLTNYEASLLGTKPKSAALLLEIVAYDQNGNRVEYNKSIIRQFMNDEEQRIQWTSSETSITD